jgi:hypothetical protein
MIIENSQVSLYSKNDFALKQVQNRSLENSISSSYQNKTTYEHSAIVSTNNSTGDNDSEKSSVQSSLKIETSDSIMIQNNRAIYKYEDHLSLEDRIKKIMIEMLILRLDPKIEALHYPSQTSTSEQSISDFSNPYNPKQKTKTVMTLVQTQEEYHQKQTIDFSSSVTIKTPNNTYNFNIDISFSKELHESRNSKLLTEQKLAIDPLVINYGEDVNAFDNISNLHFMFDLDNDGSTEMIPQLMKGAGYLALDKNQNGKIDNGSELFGPNTNDGFAELRQYDSDGNNWIDENDAVFDKLKIWSIDERGQHSLVSLLDKNVGAIYLGDVQSGFKYQTAINETTAVQKSNGIFVKNDGSGAGVVNSIDIIA